MTGKELKALREKLDISTTQAAASLGVSERTLQRWENSAKADIPEPAARLFKLQHDIAANMK
jgi:DNA-binding transcriptional regulator YiaG